MGRRHLGREGEAERSDDPRLQLWAVKVVGHRLAHAGTRSAEQGEHCGLLSRGVLGPHAIAERAHGDCDARCSAYNKVDGQAVAVESKVVLLYYNVRIVSLFQMIQSIRRTWINGNGDRSDITGGTAGQLIGLKDCDH